MIVIFGGVEIYGPGLSLSGVPVLFSQYDTG